VKATRSQQPNRREQRLIATFRALPDNRKAALVQLAEALKALNPLSPPKTKTTKRGGAQ
jgi:hypothetical protein